MTINEAQDEVIEEFSDFTDWMDKYQLLIDLGNEQKPLDDKYKTESNLIDGCQSRVWLQADYEGTPYTLPKYSDMAAWLKGPIAFIQPSASADTRAERTHAAGDSRHRPLFHRPHRSERPSLAHPLKRSAGHGQADQNVCAGVQS